MLLEAAALDARLNTVAWLRSLLTTASFYTVVFFLFTVLFMFVLSRPFGAVARLVCVGLLAGLVPPLLNQFLSVDSAGRYIYFVEFTWSLFARDQPLSESLILWAVIGGCGIVAALVTRSVARAAMAVLGAYTIFQGCSLVFLCVKARTFRPEEPVNLVFIGLSLLCYLGIRARSLYASLARIVHGLPHALLVLCGAAWAGLPIEGAIERAGFVLAVIFFLIVQNDHYDREEDGLVRKGGPPGYLDVVWTDYFMFLLFLWLLRISPSLAMLLGLFFTAGMLYQHPSVRLKKRFCLSYKIEGLWGLLAFLAGAVERGGFPKDVSLLIPGLLVFFGASVLSVPKDYKDVEDDERAGVPTYYVVLKRAGRNIEAVHRWMAALVTLCLLVPPVVFLATGGIDWSYLSLAGLSLAPGGALVLIKREKTAVISYLVFLAAYVSLLAPATAVFRAAGI